jgi:hypothetical protein
LVLVSLYYSPIVLFLTPPGLLELQEAPGSLYILSSPVPESTQEPWFLQLENGIRNQDQGTSCVCYYWDVVVPRPLNGQGYEIYVWVVTYIKHLSIIISISIHQYLY